MYFLFGLKLRKNRSIAFFYWWWFFEGWLVLVVVFVSFGVFWFGFWLMACLCFFWGGDTACFSLVVFFVYVFCLALVFVRHKGKPK